MLDLNGRHGVSSSFQQHQLSIELLKTEIHEAAVKIKILLLTRKLYIITNAQTFAKNIYESN